jgi:hypothetical protein
LWGQATTRSHFRVIFAHTKMRGRAIKTAVFVEWCRAAIRQMPGPYRYSLDVHQRVCAAIAELAPGYRCKARREYRVPLGLIDVVWFDKQGKLVVAFEVDHGVKKKSLSKLLSQECTRCLVSLRDGYLKWPIPCGVKHIVLGVRPWSRSRYDPDDI